MARAKYIILLGPDGSGKTTLADKLAQSLRNGGQSVTRINFSFGIMPPISRMLGRGKHKRVPEGQRNSGMIRPLRLNHTVILAIWYGIDHLLGHWRLRNGVREDVVIFARSYHDFLYQRAYLNLPAVIPRFFLALGPRPDLVATPLRDPQAIHDQKPELTKEEISEQYERIRRRLQQYCYFAEIDASAGIDPTVAQLRARAYL
jgi:thymidylate kinase